LKLKKKDSKKIREDKSAVLQNNIYEATRFEGSFETKEAEEYKRTIKKGQATINKRENPNVQDVVKPVPKISKKDQMIKKQNVNHNLNQKKKPTPTQKKSQNPNKQENKEPKVPTKDKNQPNKNQPNKNQPKVDNKPETKKKQTNAPKPKRPYQNPEVNLKDMEKFVELTKKHKKPKLQWYENEQLQYAGIGVLCFIVISVVYSYIFTAPTH